MALNEGFKSGFVALVGRPNAGKSTLVNALLGKKIAITSSTAQTTRRRLRAVLTSDRFQIVFVDTPGLHKPVDALGRELNESALASLSDVDVVAMLIDASADVGRGDEWVAERVRASDARKVCVLSKIDLSTSERTAEQLRKAEGLCPWDAVVGLSAKSGHNLDAFVEELELLLPPGPLWFPRDMDCDQPIEAIVSEFVREKVLRGFRDEIPHAIGVAVDWLEHDRKKGLIRIGAVIYVERESQKGIVVGKGGRAVKRIGTEARADLEQLLGERVFLDLRVKVRPNWRRDVSQIRRFGYGD